MGAVTQLRRLRFFVVLALVLFSGCAHQLNLINAQKYYELGLQEEFRGNYSGAKEAFWRSFVNYRDAGASKAYISAAIYNLGRMTGYMCDFTKADELLKEALVLERDVTGGETTLNITKRLGELARLASARHEYEESIGYYKEAVPGLENLGVLESQPIEFAIFIEDYAFVLEKAHYLQFAQEQTAKAKAIREEHKGDSAQYEFVYYDQLCPQ